MFTSPAIPIPSRVPTMQDPDRGRSSSSAARVTVAPVTAAGSPPARRAIAEPASSRGLASEPPDRSAGRDLFPAAVVPAAAEGPERLDDDVADLGGEAVRAAEHSGRRR